MFTSTLRLLSLTKLPGLANFLDLHRDVAQDDRLHSAVRIIGVGDTGGEAIANVNTPAFKIITVFGLPSPQVTVTVWACASLVNWPYTVAELPSFTSS